MKADGERQGGVGGGLEDAELEREGRAEGRWVELEDLRSKRG